MSDLILLLNSSDDSAPDAESVRHIAKTTTASVVSLQIPTVSDQSLDVNEFLTCHYQHGIDLATINDDFKLRDILLVKTPKENSRLNFVLLHLWNWPNSTYNIDSVRVPYEGETDPRNNPKGKNPGNIWAFTEQLNDRKVGSQTRLFDPEPPETVGNGHLEIDAVERLIECHTEQGDTIHLWGTKEDKETIYNLVSDLDRKVAEITPGNPDDHRKIPVVTEELPIDEPANQSQLPDFNEMSDVLDRTIEYYLCDCREGIQNLPEESIKDVVTSPPYNIAYDPFNVPKPDPKTGEIRSPLREGYEDEMPAEQYHYLLAQTFARLNEKMDSKSADVFVNIKNNYNGGDCRPPFWILDLIPGEWKFTDLLVWRYDISYDPAKNKYKPYYEWIFRFSKGDPNINTHDNFLQDYYIPIVKGNSNEREDLIHPAIYPSKLVKTCLEISGHSGLVTDPFLGSGTTLAAAKELGRPAIGFEKEQKYEPDIKKRLQRANSPTL